MVNHDIKLEMVIKFEQDESRKDIEVKITYPVKDSEFERIVSMLKMLDVKIECNTENNVKLVNVSDIYYIESIENRTFVYCKKETYQTKYRLYQLSEKLAVSGFVQISKYCIMNINKLDSFKPLFNSRMEAVLTNGVHLHITRKYLPKIKMLLEDE